MSALEDYNAEVQRIGKEYQPRDWNDGANSIKHLADAMRDELLARIEELTSENTDLRTSLDAKGFIARWQEAENMGYQCGRSHAERDLFIAEKTAEAEKQRADEAEAALVMRNVEVLEYANKLAAAEQKWLDMEDDYIRTAGKLAAAEQRVRELEHELTTIKLRSLDGDLIPKESFYARIIELEATIARLKVCGNCHWWQLDDSIDTQCCCGSKWAEEYAQDAVQNMDTDSYSEAHESCHFTPPRWTERGEA